MPLKKPKTPEVYVECQHCNEYLLEVYRKDHMAQTHDLVAGFDDFYDLNDAQQIVANWSAKQCQALLLRLLSNYPQLMLGEHNFESEGFEIAEWISNELEGETGNES